MNKSYKFIDNQDGKPRAVAKENINAGTMIMSEKPLFSLAANELSVVHIKACLDRLNPAQVRQVLTLPNPHALNIKIDPLFSAFTTHALPQGPSHERSELPQRYGLFPYIAHFGHSCRPNVNHSWNAVTGEERLYATRAITRGEELAICRANFFDDRKERQRFLFKEYGLSCSCSVCSLQGDALEQSNWRRRELRSLYDDIDRKGAYPQEAIQMVLRGLDLLEKEGLYVFSDSFSYDGFQLCISVSDVQNAVRWLKKAAKDKATFYGEDFEACRKMRRLIRNPTDHPNAGKLQPMKLKGPADIQSMLQNLTL